MVSILPLGARIYSMKNVEAIQPKGLGAWCVPVHGMPPLKGWAVQYISGMGPEIEEGYWLSNWRVNAARDSATFGFEPGLNMCYTEESDAVAISDSLRNVAEIETKIVKI